mgnify:CR=1 FL=1
MLLERKKIGIYALDFEPTVAITYNVNRENVVENLQFWIREDFKYNYSLLRRVLEMMSTLENIEPFSEIIEPDIYQSYQETFDTEILYANYTITIEDFTTEKMSNSLKPYRDFVKITKQSINIFIKNYIEKGEMK